MTAANFLNILKGKQTTTGGPVLKSDENSHVFVFYSDHGAPGFICMPKSQDYVYADKLQQAVDYMEANKMYSKMIFYIEACESGSMFPKLKNKNVAAMTASNAKLSSWAAYCNPDDKVDGQHMGTCLGDLFSVNWMEDTEAEDPYFETLFTQH